MIRRLLLLMLVILVLIFGSLSCGRGSQEAKPVATEPTSEDVEWLARVIASEAGSVWDVDHWVKCTDEERAAVGWTVLNRVKSGTFGQTVKEIVVTPGQYARARAPSRNKRAC